MATEKAQFNRFKDAPWFPQGEEMVMIGGAGGIGSWLAFFISRGGFTPMLYDFDEIEDHNLGGQLFKNSDVGKPKVTAVGDIISECCPIKPHLFNEKITAESMTHHYVFSAFDNMQARKDLFEVWKRSVEEHKDNPEISPIFIDGRLTMEQLQVFCVTPDKIEDYEAHLFDDSEVEDAPCTMKQTSHSAAMIGAHMMGFFTNHIANVLQNETVRYLPFFYEYFIPLALTSDEC